MAGNRIQATAFLAMTIVVFGLLVASGISPVLHGELPDSDSYMRLVRVQQLHDGQSWFDSSFPRCNAPYGESSNWTRPMDLLIAVPAVVLSPLIGPGGSGGSGSFRAGAFWAGVFASPLLLVVSCFLLAWVAQPLWPDPRRWWVMPILFFQLALLTYSSPGRADHHALIAFGNIVALGFGIRLVLLESSWRRALGAGLAAAGAIWVSPEGAFFPALVWLALAIQWVRGDDEAARKVRWMSLALALGLAAAIAIERPPAQYLTIEHDKVSFVHFLAALLASAAGWNAARFGARVRSWPWRVVALVAIGAVFTAVLAKVAPGFQHGTLEAAGSEFQGTFMARIGEFQSQFPVDVKGWTFFLEFLCVPAVVLPYIFYRASKARVRPTFALHVAFALGLAGFFVLGLLHLRLSIYPEILAAPYAAHLAVRLADRRRSPVRAGFAAIAPLAAALCFGPLALAMVVQATNASAAEQASSHIAGRRSLKALAEYLETRRTTGTSPVILAQFPSQGPELLYRTGYSVVAAADHRGWSGIHDLLATWNATSDDSARAIIDARGVSLVLMSRGSGDLDVLDPGRDPRATFYGRLREGRAPSWLTPVTLPTDVARDFAVYEVFR